METSIRLVIADDHLLVRSSVRAFLSTVPRIHVIAEATSGDDALAQCLRLRPDVLLLDVDMPGISTVAIIRAVHALTPPVKVLIFTAYDDAARVMTLVEAGIAGYFLKDEAVDELDHAIATVAEGASWFSPSIAHKVATMLTNQQRTSSADSPSDANPSQPE